MIWAAALTRADVGDFMVETQGLDTKLVGAYTLVMKLMRVRGSLSTDEKELARIARCTRGYWTKTVWPKIEHMFDRRGDRLYHPELEEIPPEIRRQASARAAANARWNRPQLVSDNGPSASPSHDAAASNPHDAAACDPHTQNDAISMPVAFGAHAFSHSDASPRAGAPSLSLQDSSLSESLQNLRESLGEREGAGARGHAPGHAFSDAPGDAPGHAPHDATASKPHDADACEPHTQNSTISTPGASGRYRLPPLPRAAPRTPIPPDWKPSEAGEREARKRKYDPEEMATAFRAYYLAKGETRADWDQAFISWLERERVFSGEKRQTKVAQPSAPAAPAPPTAAEIEAQAVRDAQEAMVRKVGNRTGPLTNWYVWIKTGPRPPLAAEFAEHCLAGRSEHAYRWLEVMEAAKAEQIPPLQLPPFETYMADPERLEDQMRECEARFKPRSVA